MALFSLDNWPLLFVCGAMIVAAVIDGWKLKVPNWLTFPLILSGWLLGLLYNFGVLEGRGGGIGSALAGTALGFLLLLPVYAIGGMGAGDVKLLAGVGAWVWGTVTFYAFAVSAIIGGLIALAMVFYRRSWQHHQSQFWMIANEILTVKDPEKLSAIAAERKSSMMLLPYGIPIAIGTIAYFYCAGMLM